MNTNRLTNEIDEEFKKRFSLNRPVIKKWIKPKGNKKIERKFSKKSKILNEEVIKWLEIFWKDFLCLDDKIKKISLLSKYSDIVLKKRNLKSIRYKRNRFLVNKRYDGMYKDGCKVCGSVEHIIRHHIIQLQNGGNNHFKNLITLCEDCHGYIHEWIKTGKQLDDELSIEFKNIFSIGFHNPNG